MRTKKLTPMWHVKLPEPLPQSYPSIKKFVLDHRHEILILERHSGSGKRYFVDQKDVDKVAEKELFTSRRSRS